MCTWWYRQICNDENGALQATYTYDANGNRASLTYANGAKITYAYNRANLVTGVYNGKSINPTAYSSYTYGYNLDGNQERKTDKDSVVTIYGYDQASRLTREMRIITGDDIRSNWYSYDDYGNRISKTDSDGQTVYSYDKRNRLLSSLETVGSKTTETVYTYDANGNELTKAMTTLEPDSGTSTAQFAVVSNTPYAQINRYDLNDRLIESVSTNATAAYRYRPDGLRYDKEIDGQATRHVWDGSNIVSDLTVTPTGAVSILSGYVRGIGLIATKETAANAYRYYLSNGHGDTVQLTNNSGSVVWNYDYDAFGNSMDESGNIIDVGLAN